VIALAARCAFGANPVVHRHLDDPMAVAIAADGSTSLEHSRERQLSDATEIEDGYVLHCWFSPPMRIRRLTVEC
jgi:hypothetical protein